MRTFHFERVNLKSGSMPFPLYNFLRPLRFFAANSSEGALKDEFEDLI